ncbi:MAG: hypothetical protein K0R25_1343 [Rickettsiaceae bacterium]|jgi:hypothetical protein|nr:hypothetical protein [Rickettsiaceae bacterium]
MTRTLEIIIIIFLLALSFFLGVTYSKNVREHAGWIFEQTGDEVDLPDLSDTENPEMGVPVDENGKTIDQATPPAEDQNIVPSIEEGAATDQQNPASNPASDNKTPAANNNSKAEQPKKPSNQKPKK